MLSAQGLFDKPTAGYCSGHVQANLVVLPEKYARDFETFCRKNPKPCPILEIVGPGKYKSKTLASGADLRNTIPRYLIWEYGQVQKEVCDVLRDYNYDLVFFLLGCSFSFEQALIQSGIRLRHVDEKQNVSMFKTNIALQPCGPFKGEMVVSMRPIHRSLVAKACAITGHYPEVHGEPVHVGYPEMIGIKDIDHVDYGDPVPVKEEEIPVFWACGVTPQNVLVQSDLPFAITHAPGFMFVGDLRNEDYARCRFSALDKPSIGKVN